MFDPVALTLKTWRRLPFEWGERDCLLSMADYVQLLTGKDYAAPFRGTYSDRDGALQRVEEAGGVLALIDRTGYTRATDGAPSRGDIALIDVEGVRIPSLCTGSAVAMRLAQGVSEIEMKWLNIVAFWKVD